MSPRRLLAAALCGAAVLAAPAPAMAEAACAGAHDQPVAGELAAARAATLCLVNQERTGRGLRALREHRKLRRAAARHSRDMVRREYFDHTSPSGGTITARATRARYIRPRRAWSIAENIAWGFDRYATPAYVVQSWMDSPGHRANILSARLRDAGIGVALGSPRGGEGATYTANFGRQG